MGVGSVQNFQTMLETPQMKNVSQGNERSSGGDVFTKWVTGEKKMNMESNPRISEVFQDLERARKGVEYSVTPENLKAYKEKLGDFIKVFMREEVSREDFTLTDEMGRQKKMQVIKTIHDKNDELMAEKMHTHEDQMDSLKKINEIKGLIIDLYA